MKINISRKIMDVFSPLILVVITLVTRLYLFTYLENLYFVDCYTYLNKAILMSEGTVVQVSRGYPLIFILEIIIRLTNSLVNPIISAKLFMVLCNIALILILYFISKQFFNTVLAFFSTLFILFETNFIYYSIVPYLEVFAYLNGFLSLYILNYRFQKLDLKTIILSIFFCAISAFTRAEMLAIFAIPLVILLLINGIIYKKNRKIIIIVFLLLFFFAFLLYKPYSEYYFNVTRFNPYKRLLISMRIDVITNALNSIFNISGNTSLDAFFKIFILFGFLHVLFIKIISPLINRSDECKYSFHNRLVNYFNERTRLTVFPLIISFLILTIITIVYYSYSYKIIDGNLILNIKTITPRYLMGSQIYLSWFFIYLLSKMLNTHTMFREIDKSFITLKTKISNITLNTKYVYILFLVILLIPWIPDMWIRGLNESNKASQQMELYRITSHWLANNLNENEFTILPVEEVFHVLDWRLRNKSISYKLFWDKAGVPLRANNTLKEYYEIRSEFIKYITENNSIKYVVVDWMDIYCKEIFSLELDDEINFLLDEVHEESVILSTGWMPRITVYEILRNVETIFHYNFSLHPEQYSFKVFGNCKGDYSINSEGLSLNLYEAEIGSTAVFYLPLERPIEITNFKTIIILANISMLSNNSLVEVNFYLDKNRDGSFSGYYIDYVETITSSFEEILKTSMDTFTLIKQVRNLNDPIVQIAIRLKLYKDNDESYLTINELTLLTPEISP